jgi:myosin heavy subunit
MALDIAPSNAPDTVPTAPATAPAVVSPAPATTSAPAADVAPSLGRPATSADGEAAPATPAQQAAAIAEIEALLDGAPMKLREDLQLPWKRGEETGTVSLREAINGYQREADYTRKMQAFSTERRSFEQTRLDVETTRRQIEAERTAVQREMQRHLEALTSGDETKLERYNRHLEMLAGDEDYRKTYERSLKAEAYEAREGLHSELSQQQYVQAVQADIADAVTRFSQELSMQPEQVDRVLARYETLVQQQGQAALTERTLRRLFDEEASYAQTVSTPFKSELEALKAEIAALKSGSQADAHNTRVRTTVQKATTARAAATPGGGAPTIGAGTGAPQRPQSREERHRAFMRS